MIKSKGSTALLPAFVDGRKSVLHGRRRKAKGSAILACKDFLNGSVVVQLQDVTTGKKVGESPGERIGVGTRGGAGGSYAETAGLTSWRRWQKPLVKDQRSITVVDGLLYASLLNQLSVDCLTFLLKKAPEKALQTTRKRFEGICTKASKKAPVSAPKARTAAPKSSGKNPYRILKVLSVKTGCRKSLKS